MITALIGVALLISLKLDKSRISSAALAGLFVFGVDYNFKEHNSRDVKYVQGCFLAYHFSSRGNKSLVAETINGKVKFRYNTFFIFKEGQVNEGECGEIGYFSHLGGKYLMSFTGGSDPGSNANPD